MSERWKQQIAFTTTGPTTGQLRLIGAETSRSVQQFSRVNAFRHLAESEAAINKWALRLREEWIASQAQLWAAAIGTLSGGVYEIAEATADPQLFDFSGVGTADGAQVALDSCALTEWQIAVDTKQIVTSETTWSARRLRSIADTPPVYVAPTSAVSPCVCRVTVDAVDTACFGIRVAFARDIQPAAFDEAGDANAWAGIAAPTITGKAVLRLSPALYGIGLRTLFVSALTLEINGWILSIPQAVCAITRRVMIDEELYTHEIDFAAKQSATSRLATITP